MIPKPSKVICPRLYFYPHRLKKDGTAALYLRVILDRQIKDFPLKLNWPAERIDLQKQILLSRQKDDKDVDDYNLIIQCEKNKHTEIQLNYRIRNESITLEKLAREVKVFDSRECFTSYMELERNRRYKKREIECQTFKNSGASLALVLEFDQVCLFKNINKKWMRNFKQFLINKKYKPGTVWARIKDVKTYLRHASAEPMLFVDPEAINYPNPKPQTVTVYLVEDEVKRLEALRRKPITELQEKVLKGFLFCCFTGLRISDLYNSNPQWEVEDDFLTFIPFKNRKKGKLLKIPFIPLAKELVEKDAKTFFNLPNRVQFNETLKDLAKLAGIRKNLTSHVGRHTFGLLFMESAENIYALQQILGHTKLETTERYAHISDRYKMESALKIQRTFNKS